MNQGELEQLAARLRRQWRPQHKETPSHVLVWVPDTDVYNVEDGGEVFLVVEESTTNTIVRMMNRNGQIYSAVRSQCQDLDRERQILMCPRADMILCSGDTDKDRFVSDNLRPLLEEERS